MAGNRPANEAISEVARTEAAYLLGKTWPNGTRLKVRFLNGTASEQAFVRQYAVEWSRYANLDFDFTNAGSSEIRISFGPYGSWSYVGNDATQIPLDQPTMNFGWQASGTVLHEFGHALGMIHEHQNPRSNPIVWNEPEVIRYFGGPPNNWDPDKVRRNVILLYSETVTNGSQFDPDSIMLYSYPSRLTLNGVGTHENSVLSAIDQQVIARMYPGRGSVTPSNTPLRLDAPISSSISAAGEEDIYSFEVLTSGRYRFETTGGTDLVMTIFDSNNVRLSYDDDSGGNLQPRIIRNLMPGRYSIRLGHYGSTGTGSYTLSVKRV